MSVGTQQSVCLCVCKAVGGTPSLRGAPLFFSLLPFQHTMTPHCPDALSWCFRKERDRACVCACARFGVRKCMHAWHGINYFSFTARYSFDSSSLWSLLASSRSRCLLMLCATFKTMLRKHYSPHTLFLELTQSRQHSQPDAVTQFCPIYSVSA